ncbi:MAG: hypothetical protein IJ088_08985 [Clostridia bacterium]|nr:hypothetical protein [Clostridia bacterium]
MTAKRFCRLTLGGIFLCLLLIIATVAVIDPFEIYHRALFYIPSFRSEIQSYSNAGVAKSFDYDSVIVGSSVTENCIPSVYEEALGGRFVKLCMNAGTAMDHARMLEMAFRTHRVRRVVYGVDVFAYPVYWTNQKMETPNYLYDASLLNDVQYWFNEDVIFKEIPYALTHLGKMNEQGIRDWMYVWNPPERPTPESLQVTVKDPVPGQEPSRMELIEMNIEHNLIPFFEAHPDTEFDLFFPPYSLSYWRDQMNRGQFEADMECRNRIIEAVTGYANVHLYDFALLREWITDYSHYYDYRHYTSEINDAIAFAIRENRMRITSAEQGKQNTDELRRLVMDKSVP